MSSTVVSVVASTVGRMTTTRTHTCIYFDDGDLEHRCACGSRAFYLTEQDGVLDGTEPVLVVLAEDPTAVADRRLHDLAVPA